MYKLLALDIDETLLSMNQVLSPENKAAIQKAKEQGVIVTLSTGRAYTGTKKVCEMIDMDNIPVVTFGGAQINSYPSGEVIYESVMSESLVRECIAFARRHNVYIQCYDGDAFYYQESCEESNFYEQRLAYKGTETELDRFQFLHAPKCLIIAQPFMIDKLLPIAKAHFDKTATVMRSYSRFLEFYNPGVSKGSAVAWLAESLGIAQDEVIAIGDSDLDVPMIEYAGLGVAVANATRDAIGVANYVAPHVDQNAVAHVVNKFILGE